jgi:hypothetical protein
MNHKHKEFGGDEESVSKHNKFEVGVSVSLTFDLFFIFDAGPYDQGSRYASPTVRKSGLINGPRIRKSSRFS